MAHLHTVLRGFDGRLGVRGGRGAGHLAPGAGVGRRADDDGLVDLHDGTLDRIWKRATGGRSHVHDHTALRGGNLQRTSSVSHVFNIYNTENKLQLKMTDTCCA